MSLSAVELRAFIETLSFNDNGKVAVIVGQTGSNYEIIQVDADGNLIISSMDELLEEVGEVEYHMHTRERWFGISGDQSGNDWADESSLTPFVATSGNNTWGTATPAKVLGTDDTPLFTGGLYYDPHKILISANTSTTLYKVRLIWGTDTNIAAVAAGQYSEFMYLRAPGDTSRQVFELRVPRIPVDNKLWVECWNATNGATISFYVGIHEYDF